MSTETHNLENQFRQIKKRPGFSVNNAMRFKPAFDHALDKLNDPEESNKDVLVDYASIPQLSRYTFAQRMSEALRWLIEYHNMIPSGMAGKYVSKDYATLRGLVKLRPGEKGVLIEFPGSTTASYIDLGFKTKSDLSRTSWKTKLQDFVDSGPQGKVHSQTGLLLTDEDVEWVRTYLSGAFTTDQFKVDHNSIVLIK